MRYGSKLDIVLPALVAGCVSVDTGRTRVDVGVPRALYAVDVRADAPATEGPPYARALRRAGDYQARVAEKLAEGDWEDLVKRSGEWVQRVRELSSYAESSHDSLLFRRYCDELLRHAENARHAALARDGEGCRRALNAADPVLAKITRTFPLSGSPPAAAASPSPAPEPAAAPTGRPLVP